MLTPEQKKWRRKGIGGSDVSSLYDLNPFTCQIETWADKYRPDLGDALDRESTRLRCGSHLEAFTRKELSRGGAQIVLHVDDCSNSDAVKLAERVKEKGVRFAKGKEMLRSNLYPHMLANTDGSHRKTGGILEIKTVNGISHRNGWADGPPLYIQLQCMQYMGVTGAPFALVAALVDMAKIHLYVINRDDELIASMGERIEAWWHTHIVKGIMPETDHSSSCEHALNALYPEPDPMVGIELDAEGISIANTLDELRKQEKVIKEQVKGAKNKIAAIMGDAECAVMGDSGSAVYRTKNKRGAFTIRIAKAPKKAE